uniref:Uncharacterized protein n=1 Tax=Tetranychus urticae TaxID=32264 RepID=T1L0F0_TETUR
MLNSLADPQFPSNSQTCVFL